MADQTIVTSLIGQSEAQPSPKTITTSLVGQVEAATPPKVWTTSLIGQVEVTPATGKHRMFLLLR